MVVLVLLAHSGVIVSPGTFWWSLYILVLFGHQYIPLGFLVVLIFPVSFLVFLKFPGTFWWSWYSLVLYNGSSNHETFWWSLYSLVLPGVPGIPCDFLFVLFFPETFW